MSMICKILAITVTVWAIGIYVSSANRDSGVGFGAHAAGLGPAQDEMLAIAENG